MKVQVVEIHRLFISTFQDKSTETTPGWRGSADVPALERAELLRDAKEWEDRKMKICKTEHYRKNLSFS